MGGLNLKGDSGKNVAQLEDEGAWIELRDAAGEELMFERGEKKVPIRILVAGTYSNIYRKAQEAQRARMIRKRRSTLTPAELAHQQLELSAACCLDWDGVFSDENGTVAECNRENAMQLLKEMPWIHEQVQEAMLDHEAFFRKNS